MELMVSLEGMIIFMMGNTRTAIIIRIIRVKVFLCLSSKGSGFLKVMPFPISRFSLNPKRKIVIRITENTIARPKIINSVENESAAGISGLSA